MRRAIPALLLLIVATSASAQTAMPRFKAGAEVIAIDVTVVDRNGTPIADLSASDFEVSVEGKPRAIQSAQFLNSNPALQERRADESANTDPASGRLLVIVTDDGSLRSDSHAVVDAAHLLLDHLGPGDMVGVTHIPDGGGVPLTTDRRRVIAELQRVRPETTRIARSDTTVYISEALDLDGQQRLQWPAAVMRECGAEADSPVFRLCKLNLEQTARALLIDSSIHANDTIRGLERIMKTLAPSGQPVTMVLISGSLVLARDPAALAGLAEACAEARVTLHVVQPAPPTAVMTERGYPSDPVLDTALANEGLEQIAAHTRGEFYRAVGSGAPIFERIGRELAGYYLLGIEPADEDRKKPRRRVDVRVRRPGVTIRARSMFALDHRATETSTDAAMRLRQMLESPVPAKGLPIRITSRIVSGDARQVRVLIAAEIGDATDQQERYAVGVIAVDGNGEVKSRSAATTMLAPAREGRQSPSLFTTSLLLDPGDYALRLAAVDAQGRSGSVHHVVRAALHEWPDGWRSSDLIAANQPRTNEFPPFNASSIVDTPGIAAILELANDDRTLLDAAQLRFDIDGHDAGPAVNAQPTSAEVRSFAALLPSPGAGEHRLRATIESAGRAPIVIERSFSYSAPLNDPMALPVIGSYIDLLERRHAVSPLLAGFVAEARAGRFTLPPDAETRPDGDIAMVTFVGGLAALRDHKPALARALFQQTLRKAPAFEGALFYLSLIP